MTATRPTDALAALVGVPRVDDAETPTVRPRTTEEVAQIMRTASAEGWRVSIQGRGRWQSPPEADVNLCLRDLEPTLDIRAADLVVSASAAVSVTTLASRLAGEKIWLPLDPPGVDRSIGGMIATGAAGTLECGFGPVRDYVLGLTVVTGDGRILTLGGQVVKNVAGFDLIRLMVGAHGAYGVITGATLRARTLPITDRTLVYRGTRDELLALLRDITEARLSPAACTLQTNTASGSAALRLRVVGSDPHVRQVTDRLRELSDNRRQETSGIADVIAAEQGARADGMVGVRMGFAVGSLPDADALVRDALGEGQILLMPGRLVWSGTSDRQRIERLRTTCREAGFTTVVERAPPDLLDEIGHYGRAGEPRRSILDRLRAVFDPRGVMRCPLESRT